VVLREDFASRGSARSVRHSPDCLIAFVVFGAFPRSTSRKGSLKARQVRYHLNHSTTENRHQKAKDAIHRHNAHCVCVHSRRFRRDAGARWQGTLYEAPARGAHRRHLRSKLGKTLRRRKTSKLRSHISVARNKWRDYDCRPCTVASRIRSEEAPSMFS
jgi:hypothetical protein